MNQLNNAQIVQVDPLFHKLKYHAVVLIYNISILELHRANHYSLHNILIVIIKLLIVQMELKLLLISDLVLVKVLLIGSLLQENVNLVQLVKYGQELNVNHVLQAQSQILLLQLVFVIHKLNNGCRQLMNVLDVKTHKFILFPLENVKLVQLIKYQMSLEQNVFVQEKNKEIAWLALMDTSISLKKYVLLAQLTLSLVLSQIDVYALK